MRKFAPLLATHPLVGDMCPFCSEAFVVGDEVTLIEVRPADDEEAVKKAQGRVYTAEAKPHHWVCGNVQVERTAAVAFIEAAAQHAWETRSKPHHLSNVDPTSVLLNIAEMLELGEHRKKKS